ncbi:hypothetical protein MMC06_001422, partial [Schaereria dolodes]|nr:hypothetical protein [Schaereria dolodes]
LYNQIVYKHYRRVIGRWPVDRLRPEVSFQKVVQQRMEKNFKLSSSEPEEYVVAKEVQGIVPAPVRADAKTELEQRLMSPLSHPTYYRELITELKEAPERSWVGRMVNKWKGFLRFS